MLLRFKIVATNAPISIVLYPENHVFPNFLKLNNLSIKQAEKINCSPKILIIYNKNNNNLTISDMG